MSLTMSFQYHTGSIKSRIVVYALGWPRDRVSIPHWFN
jgi:hypothetical protein